MLDYEIQYKKGVDNTVADALSRMEYADSKNDKNSGVKLAALSALQLVWIEQVVSSYENDEECQKIISQLLLDPNSNTEFQFIQGMLKKQGKIYLGKMEELEIKS